MTTPLERNLQEKRFQEEQWDSSTAHDALEFIKKNIGENFETSGNLNNFEIQLKDGVKLCKLVNALRPGTIPIEKYTEPPTSFNDQMIKLAIDGMKQLGVDKMSQTSDFCQPENLRKCLESICDLKALRNN